MTYPELLDAINARNIKLELKLVVVAPRGAMTDAIRSALAEHKPHLLAKLGRDAQWEVLSRQRWGPALIEAPADGSDPYARAERQAIQSEALIDVTVEWR